MSTVIRPELSEKNENWIPRHRYYELKHFCMQYNSWQKILAEKDIYPRIIYSEIKTEYGNPTEKFVIERERYVRYVGLVDRAANMTDPVLGNYILKGIINGVSYDALKSRLNIPCGKDIYYEMYRRFFAILDKIRN